MMIDSSPLAKKVKISSNEQYPLVSVLMATYNRHKRLIRAIESVRAQTYPNWELCLVCDGSKPVDDIVKSFNDPRIIYKYNEQNKGYGHTANTAFTLSKGEYLAYLGDDDIWLPNHIELLMKLLLSQSEAHFAYANALCTRRKVNKDGSLSIVKQYLPCLGHANLVDILECNNITGISAIHAREFFERVGGFDEKLKCLIDFDLWRRILCYSKTLYLNKVTSEYYEDIECTSDHLTNLARQNPLLYKVQQLRLLFKKLPNGMEQRLANSLQYLRKKHLYMYIIGARTAALDQGDVSKAQKFSKIAEKYPFTAPAGKNVDLAIFLMRDGEIKTALNLFKMHLGETKNSASVYFVALECAILCKDPWAHEVFGALLQDKHRLPLVAQKHLAKLAVKLKQM